MLNSLGLIQGKTSATYSSGMDTDLNFQYLFDGSTWTLGVFEHFVDSVLWVDIAFGEFGGWVDATVFVQFFALERARGEKSRIWSKNERVGTEVKSK